MTRPAEAGAPLIDIDDLRVTYGAGGRAQAAVDGVSLTIGDGQSVGIVGESGSGKSTLARALLGLLPRRSADIAAGHIRVAGRAMAPGQLHALRGTVAAMVFQDPLSYLNPLMTAGDQIAEAVRLHDRSASTTERVVELLEQVQLTADARGQYPHELSGGMRQRVLLAIALACRPRLLIADEPTTALDVTTQREILTLIQRLRAETGMALLLISHDLGVVSTLCEHIHVMLKGRVVESGPVDRIFAAPQAAYTRQLLAAAIGLRDERGRFLTMPTASMGPDGAASAHATRATHATHANAATSPSATAAALRDGDAGASNSMAPPVLELRDIVKTFHMRGGRGFRAVAGVSLAVHPGETLALVGESGSGKSTLSRVALGLLEPDRGTVLLNGRDLHQLAPTALRTARVDMQPVFQDASAAFNPRRTIGQALAQALRLAARRVGPAADRAEQASIKLLEEVGLVPGAQFLPRYPHELSGGQRQRLSIARALAARPALIIADEPLSGADVSIRGQILNLLQDLQAERGLAYLFVTHDISLARVFAHRVAVMYRGEIVEHGPAERVLAQPAHAYTQRLVQATPRIGPEAGRAGGGPVAKNASPAPAAQTVLAC
ncbi:dipeptide ABC transporter ATP-binding protein [Bordetella genomosp. 9]|uniref:dipeptide ABC transporter ATP-binding protein n=1 Tax=Bordetella genomosp. 9 TaxID=1416803 RepID=UPI0015C584BD|nr:ABC transporter ATP-binding protein [Bordetella genomosp. 9]